MTADFEAKLQTELQAAMGDGFYRINEFYALYVRVMSQSFDMKYPIITLKTFKNKVSAWSSAEGSWLIKNGLGKKALYHVWVCHRYPKLTRKQIGSTAKKILEGLATWRK